MFVTLCNKESRVKTKHNDPLTFQSVNDCWGTHSNEGMPGVILSCKVVAACGLSSFQKVNKQVEGKIKNFKDQGTQKLGNKEAAKKVMKQGRSPIPSDILADIYQFSVEIKCPLVYLGDLPCFTTF